MRTPYSRIDPHEYEKDGAEASKSPLVVERLERCNFCNSRLVFSHDLNISYLQVIETGRCPGCGVTMVPKKYTLH